jgi:hypothetical protein
MTGPGALNHVRSPRQAGIALMKLTADSSNARAASCVVPGRCPFRRELGESRAWSATATASRAGADDRNRRWTDQRDLGRPVRGSAQLMGARRRAGRDWRGRRARPPAAHQRPAGEAHPSLTPTHLGDLRIAGNKCRIVANNCRIALNKCRIASEGQSSPSSGSRPTVRPGRSAIPRTAASTPGTNDTRSRLS